MGVREALEAQRKAEQEFVAEALRSETAPRGWPAALLMFHLSMWRERLLHSLTAVADGRPQLPPPTNTDDVNDTELAGGIGTPLADAAGRSDTLLGEIIAAYEKLGERPFDWYSAKTTTEAVLRNSYTHPRLHMNEYLRENGDTERAYRLFEDAETEMRGIAAPPVVMATVLYNLACVRAIQGRADDALSLLEEALPMRTELKGPAAEESDLEPLRNDPRFQAIITE